MADEPNKEPTPEIVPDPSLLVDDSTKEFFEQYVGPGKKYANVGELAKGYANADRHLSEVTKDAGLFKTESESLKELLMETLKNEPKPNDEPKVNPNVEPPLEQPPAGAPPKEKEDVDIKALVKEALGEVTTEDKRKANADAVEAATIKQFGSKEDALKAIADKAAELDISPQWIANLAFESPKAFYSTMGFQPDVASKSSTTPASSSEVNAGKLKEFNPGAPAPGTYRFYAELRRTDPAKYRSKEIQQEIMKAAQENPDFYK